MDPNYIIGVSAVVICTLIASNMVWMKIALNKIETSWLKVNIADSRITTMERQMEDISSMKTDIGILKSEILRYIKSEKHYR